MSECPQDGCTADITVIQCRDAFVEWGRDADDHWRFALGFNHNPTRQWFHVFCSAGHAVTLNAVALPEELHQIVRKFTEGQS